VKPYDPVNVACPVCGRSPVTCMVPSERGAYCGCDFCGHMWQQEGLFLNRPASQASNFKRRKSDWADTSGGTPVIGSPCSHCGRVDERHEYEIGRLMRRIAQLESENALLESSAKAFGELAERLNERIRPDRRSGLDRRKHPRTTPDRRVWKPLEG
jgi:hypothetical protein